MTHIRKWACPPSFLAIGIAAFIVVPRAAHAGVSACGDIDITANANCQLVTSTQCTSQCTDTSFEKCCAAKLEQQCDSQCNASADTMCTAQCATDCTTSCTTTPGSFDCSTDCQGRCGGSCSSSCSSSSTQTDCEASCSACCDDHCDTNCTSVAPSVDCTTKCNASCQGDCTAQANVACQSQCQEMSYPQCKNDFVQTCTTQCGQPQGALFCDGDYVDVGGNLTQCVDALNAILTTKIDVSVTGSGSATCQGDECTGQGNATVKTSCAVSPGPEAPAGGILAAGFGIALGALRRRKKN